MTARTWACLSVIGWSVAFVPNAGAELVLGNPGSIGIIPSTTSVAALPDPFRLNFNENGNASFVDSNGGSGTLQGTLKGVPGGTNLVLQFTLLEPVVTGTVSFSEPGGGTSDWLQFADANFSTAGTTLGTTMIYISDLPEGGEPADRADTGLPLPLPSGNLLQCGVSPFCAGEIGSEGNNGVDYRPGGVGSPYPLNNEYIGVSDVPVPAPPIGRGLSVLLAVGGVLFGAKLLEGNRRRRSLENTRLPAKLYLADDPGHAAPPFRR